MWQNDDLAFNMGSEMVGLCRIPEGVTVTLFGYVKLHPKTLLKLFLYGVGKYTTSCFRKQSCL